MRVWYCNDGRPPPSALTDALIAGIANGSQSYKLVGSYVTTPLNWYALDRTLDPLLKTPTLGL